MPDDQNTKSNKVSLIIIFLTALGLIAIAIVILFLILTPVPH